VWLGTSASTGRYGTIASLDPRTNRVTRSISIREGLFGANALAADETATWGVGGEGVIWIDPKTGDVTHIAGPGTTGASESTIADVIAVGAGKAWVAGEASKRCGNLTPNTCPRLPGILWRVDPATDGVDAQARIGKSPTAMAVGAGAVWIGDRGTRSIWRLDPESLAVVQKIKLGQVPADIVVANGLVWVALGD
jgi:virginiamycin B lyase